MKKLINTALFYAIFAMVGGVFYREFTKFNSFSGKTTLAFVHLHLFVLGMFFFLVLILFNKQYSITENKRFSLFYTVYNTGLLIMAGTFLWRGTLQVLGTTIPKGVDAAISGVAGLGHIAAGTGIILIISIIKSVAVNTQKN